MANVGLVKQDDAYPVQSCLFAKGKAEANKIFTTQPDEIRVMELYRVKESVNGCGVCLVQHEDGRYQTLNERESVIYQLQFLSHSWFRLGVMETRLNNTRCKKCWLRRYIED